MVKRRRIALVGAGHISKKHISAINTLESKLDHVAICENNLEISSLIVNIGLKKGTCPYKYLPVQ